MKKKEIRVSPVAHGLFIKYHDALISLDCIRVIDPLNNYVVDISRLSELNEALRRLSMTIEYIMANEASEVESE